jgi:hypothetical protein
MSKCEVQGAVLNQAACCGKIHIRIISKKKKIMKKRKERVSK